MYTKYALLLSLFLLTHNGKAENFQAGFQRPGEETGPQLFRLEAQRDGNAWVDHYRDASGRDAVIERLWFRDGQLQRYEFDDRQEGGLGSAERGPKGLRLAWTQDGRTEEKWVALPERLIGGPSYVPLLQERWEALLAGERITATVPVLSRRRLMTAGLSFQRRRQDEAPGRVRVVMKPAHWFVALFFPPIRLDFDAASRRLLRVEGRSLLKEKVDGEWKMTDVVGTYKYGP